MSTTFPTNTDHWILEKAPRSEIVISSRARLARNLPDSPFAPRARNEQLSQIAQSVRKVIESANSLTGFTRFELSLLEALDRQFLRESHLISAELEKGREHREVYLSTDASTSIMINEEDHLRIQTMMAGFRISDVYRKVDSVERALEKVLPFAYRPQFGYLTACPTNTGTGLRVSVMLHLIGLVMTNQVEEALAPMGNFGLVVRGAYGEHSGHTGDLFQISNEITLGRTEEDLIDVLGQVMGQLIERENSARDYLFKRETTRCEDAVERAIGTLRHARSIDSNEAVTLLSRIRLGIGRNPNLKMTHEELNRLMIEVQPAHLVRAAVGATESSDRDVTRANFLRQKFNGGNSTFKM